MYYYVSGVRWDETIHILQSVISPLVAKVRTSDVYLDPGRTDFYLYVPPTRLISRPHISTKYGPSFVKRWGFNILTVL
jgi:hypothetical protein